MEYDRVACSWLVAADSGLVVARRRSSSPQKPMDAPVGRRSESRSSLKFSIWPRSRRNTTFSAICPSNCCYHRRLSIPDFLNCHVDPLNLILNPFKPPPSPRLSIPIRQSSAFRLLQLSLQSALSRLYSVFAFQCLCPFVRYPLYDTLTQHSQVLKFNPENQPRLSTGHDVAVIMKNPASYGNIPTLLQRVFPLPTCPQRAARLFSTFLSLIPYQAINIQCFVTPFRHHPSIRCAILLPRLCELIMQGRDGLQRLVHRVPREAHFFQPPA